MLSVVLARRDWREYDQLITLYTRETGRRQTVARGVKKITSKNATHLDVPGIVEADILPGKEVDYLLAVQPVDSFIRLAGDWRRLCVWNFARRLVEQLVRESAEDHALFELLVSFGVYLNTAEQILLSAADSFTLKLLARLGFSPELENCAACGGKLVGERLVFVPSLGGLAHWGCLPANTGTPLGSIPFSEAQAQQLRELLTHSWAKCVARSHCPEVRQAISSFLAYHSEKKNILFQWPTE